MREKSDIMKKIKGKILILSIFIAIVILSTIKLYNTYAIDEIDENDSYTFSISGDTTVTIPSFSYKDLIYQIKNTNPGTVKYGVGYSSNNSTVYIYYDSPDDEVDSIEKNEIKTVKLRIENNSDTDDLVEIKTILGYESGGNLIVPNGVTMVTEKVYTVTFDANGGKASMPTKVVKLGATYGDLPTATRSGYTFLGWEDKILPDEYQQVEYIQMDSTSPKKTFITTGIQLNNISKIELKYSFTTETRYNPMVLSSYTSSSTESNTPWICVNGYKNGDNWSITPVTQKTQVNTPTEYTVNSSLTSTNFLKIGGWTDDYWTPVGRYYYVKIFDTSNELIRHFIPCYKKSNDSVGMYDISNDLFYESAGTEKFTKGEKEIVTSSTIVKKETNHTLTAIWEEDNS